MTNSEMKKAIRGMAEQLAEHVVKLLGSATLKELSALSEGAKRPASSASAKPKAQLPAKSEKPAKSAKSAKPAKATKPAKAAKATKPAAPRPTAADVSADVQKVLKANGDYMKGKAIIAELVTKPTDELLGRVLRDLIARKLVVKRGLTRNSEYMFAL